jgi:hypothetical protein
MAGAKQPAIADAAEAQISLFMRARPFTGDDALAITNKQNIGSANAHAGYRLLGQPRQRQSLNPPRFLPHHDKPMEL